MKLLKLRRKMETIRARLAQQEHAQNASVPLTLVQMYETPIADHADDWGTIVAANNFTMHPALFTA